MGIGTALARIASSIVGKAVEGQPRQGPWHLPISGGWLTPGPPGYGSALNWWQLGGNISGHSRSAMIEACVSAYSQTVAQCPGDHWRRLANGGRKRVTTSALSRILRKPNDYQSISDFMLNITRSLYLEGNCYALVLRNERYEPDELHWMDARQSRPFVAETGEIFYYVGGNNIIERRLGALDNNGGRLAQLIVPARDILHIRLQSNERNPWPLIGESPLLAALDDLEMYDAIKNQQLLFFKNQARPSAVLSTDLTLDKDQLQALRDRWNEQAKGVHAGGVPILTSGLKVLPWSTAGGARDMQVAEMMQASDNRIALLYRIPLAVLGIQNTTAHNAEQLMSNWLGMGLGFCLNHIEEAIGNLFKLQGQPDEYVEFSTDALLRSARKDRIEMLVRGVQGGVFSPNEARAEEDLPAVAYGESPRVQAQVIPLSAAGAIPSAPAAPVPDAVPSAPIPRQLTKAQHVADLTTARRRVAGGRR